MPPSGAASSPSSSSSSSTPLFAPPDGNRSAAHGDSAFVGRALPRSRLTTRATAPSVAVGTLPTLPLVAPLFLPCRMQYLASGATQTPAAHTMMTHDSGSAQMHTNEHNTHLSIAATGGVRCQQAEAHPSLECGLASLCDRCTPAAASTLGSLTLGALRRPGWLPLLLPLPPPLPPALLPSRAPLTVHSAHPRTPGLAPPWTLQPKLCRHHHHQ